MLPNVSFDDMGNPKIPGEYCVNDQYFMVDQKHLAVWQQDPQTRFNTVLCTRIGDDRVRFALSNALEA